MKEGILKIEPEDKSFSFELTLFYNQEQKDLDWFLLSVEHKIEKLTKVEKVRANKNFLFQKFYLFSNRKLKESKMKLQSFTKKEKEVMRFML